MLHHNARDLTGFRSGKLLVLHTVGSNGDGHVNWLCRCDCGREKVIVSTSLLRKKSASQSCGCNNRERAQARRRPDGAWNDGKSYAIRNGEHCYRHRHTWAKAAIRHYGNRCERCGWAEARCDVHHRHAKAKGGLHTLENAIVLCPNCHRIQHEREARQ